MVRKKSMMKRAYPKGTGSSAQKKLFGAVLRQEGGSKPGSLVRSLLPQGGHSTVYIGQKDYDAVTRVGRLGGLSRATQLAKLRNWQNALCTPTEVCHGPRGPPTPPSSPQPPDFTAPIVSLKRPSLV